MSDDPLIDWSWIGSHTDEIRAALSEHIQLAAIAVAIGLLISLPLGIFAYRHRRWYGPIAGVTGVLYTIPSIALFAFLIPYTGLSTTTAEIGLISYTLLILIRNIVAGLEGVPEDAREAGRGMGYSDGQLLTRVELPLAVPVIVAGIRIATVTTIGLVTVTALIGKGGLGIFIRRGIQTFDSTETLVGAVLSTVLAIFADILFLGAQKLLTPWSRRQRLGGA